MNSWQIFWNRVKNPGTINSILTGLQNTAVIAVFGLLLGFVIGCLLATVKIIQSKNPAVKGLQYLADGYIAVFRGTPMMVQAMFLYYTFSPCS